MHHGRHSRFVRAIGNGNYTTVATIRGVTVGALTAILTGGGAILWSLKTDVAALSATVTQYVKAQQQRDASQNQRMNRLSERLNILVERILNER
jgi:hypothetical protein